MLRTDLPSQEAQGSPLCKERTSKLGHPGGTEVGSRQMVRPAGVTEEDSIWTSDSAQLCPALESRASLWLLPKCDDA